MNREMKILKQLAIIFGVYVVSDLIAKLSPFGLPASVVGLIIFIMSLKVGVIKESAIKESADFITKNMALFFVPVSLRIIEDFAQFENQFMSILIVILVTLIITFLSSVYITILVQKIIQQRQK